MKPQFSNTPFFLLSLFAVLFLITSCGSFSPVRYYNDGIYGDIPLPKKQYNNNTDGKYYKKYFGDKAKELANNNRDVEVDSISKPTQNNRDIDNININIYGYGSNGFYHDYNYRWNDNYYRPWWRHYRYRPWHSWSYYYEPYYYGWSYYSLNYVYYPHSYYGYNPYYHYYGSSYYYNNPKQYVASSGRRGAPIRGTLNMRSNSTNSLSGDSYQIQRRFTNGTINTVNYNVGRHTSSNASTSTVKESGQNDASNFMTRDYSIKRNYRSSSNFNNISGSNNSYYNRISRFSNNNFNSTRSSNRSYNSGNSSSSRSSSGSSSRSSSRGRR